MESINENSEELYRKKYLKYKQKYLDAQKGEELEGGLWFDKTFIFCPEDVYNMIGRLYDSEGITTKNKYFNNKNLFLLLLGGESYYTVYGTKELKKCWPSKEDKDNQIFWEYEDYESLGYIKKKEMIKKFYSKEEKAEIVVEDSIIIAKDQIKKKKQNGILQNLNYFYFESKPVGGFLLSFPDPKKNNTQL
jgi:hypothetical protein